MENDDSSTQLGAFCSEQLSGRVDETLVQERINEAL